MMKMAHASFSKLVLTDTMPNIFQNNVIKPTISEVLQLDSVKRLLYQPNFIVKIIPGKPLTKSSEDMIPYERNNMNVLNDTRQSDVFSVRTADDEKEDANLLPSKIKHKKSEIAMLPIEKKSCGHYEPCENIVCDVTLEYVDENNASPMLALNIEEDEINAPVGKHCENKNCDALSIDHDRCRRVLVQLYRCDRSYICDICRITFKKQFFRIRHKNCKRKKEYVHNNIDRLHLQKERLRMRELQILETAKKKKNDYSDPAKTIETLRQNAELIIIPQKVSSQSIVTTTSTSSTQLTSSDVINTQSINIKSQITKVTNIFEHMPITVSSQNTMISSSAQRSENKIKLTNEIRVPKLQKFDLRSTSVPSLASIKAQTQVPISNSVPTSVSTSIPIPTLTLTLAPTLTSVSTSTSAPVATLALALTPSSTSNASLASIPIPAQVATLTLALAPSSTSKSTLVPIPKTSVSTPATVATLTLALTPSSTSNSTSASCSILNPISASDSTLASTSSPNPASATAPCLASTSSPTLASTTNPISTSNPTLTTTSDSTLTLALAPSAITAAIPAVIPALTSISAPTCVTTSISTVSSQATTAPITNNWILSSSPQNLSNSSVQPKTVRVVPIAKLISRAPSLLHCTQGIPKFCLVAENPMATPKLIKSTDVVPMQVTASNPSTHDQTSKKDNNDIHNKKSKKCKSNNIQAHNRISKKCKSNNIQTQNETVRVVPIARLISRAPSLLHSTQGIPKFCFVAEKPVISTSSIQSTSATDTPPAQVNSSNSPTQNQTSKKRKNNDIPAHNKILKKHKSNDIQAHNEIAKKHKNDDVQARKMKEQKKKDFFCSYCSKYITTDWYVKMHMAKHKGEKLFFCSYCDESFSNKYDMKKHMTNRHTEQKELTCDKCNYTCTSLTSFKSHVKTHVINNLNKSNAQTKKRKKLQLSKDEANRYLNHKTYKNDVKILKCKNTSDNRNSAGKYNKGTNSINSKKVTKNVKTRKDCSH